MCHRCHQAQEPKSSSDSKRAGGVSTLTASTSVNGHSKADAASTTRYRLMGSVSVCSCSSHLLSHSRNQTQQHHHHHLHLTENASGSSRAAGQQQVNGSRAYLTGTWCSLHALLVLTLGDKLCSQQLFTASRQQTACKQGVHVSTDMTVCLGAAADGRRLLASSIGCSRQSCGSAGNQASMLLYWLPQQPKWLAVPSSCTTFVTGCSTQQPLRPTLETGGTGSCAGAPSSSGSRQTLPSARKSVEAVKKLLWPMETPSSAAAAAREIPAHLQSHCGGNLGTAVRCMTRMNFAQPSFVVLARQPWMACLSLS